MGSISTKKVKILVFCQLYRSKSATLEIAYNMEIDSLLCTVMLIEMPHFQYIYYSSTNIKGFCSYFRKVQFND